MTSDVPGSSRSRCAGLVARSARDDEQLALDAEHQLAQLGSRRRAPRPARARAPRRPRRRRRSPRPAGPPSRPGRRGNAPSCRRRPPWCRPARRLRRRGPSVPRRSAARRPADLPAWTGTRSSDGAIALAVPPAGGSPAVQGKPVEVPALSRNRRPAHHAASRSTWVGRAAPHPSRQRDGARAGRPRRGCVARGPSRTTQKEEPCHSFAPRSSRRCSLPPSSRCRRAGPGRAGRCVHRPDRRHGRGRRHRARRPGVRRLRRRLPRHRHGSPGAGRVHRHPRRLGPDLRDRRAARPVPDDLRRAVLVATGTPRTGPGRPTRRARTPPCRRPAASRAGLVRRQRRPRAWTSPR